MDCSDQEELGAFRAKRRRYYSELEPESLIKHFALALSFFDRYLVMIALGCILIYYSLNYCCKSGLLIFMYC